MMTEQHAVRSSEETAEVYPVVDENTYEAARPHLKAALEYTLVTGRSVRDFGEFCLDRFGSTIVPYVKRFLIDVREQRVTIDGLGDSAKHALFGTVLTADERERRIRERAYLRAERRGFVNGSAEEDWTASEREVDREIAQQTGLLGRARGAALSLGELVQHGFEGMKSTMDHWLQRRPPDKPDASR